MSLSYQKSTFYQNKIARGLNEIRNTRLIVVQFSFELNLKLVSRTANFSERENIVKRNFGKIVRLFFISMVQNSIGTLSKLK